MNWFRKTKPDVQAEQLENQRLQSLNEEKVLWVKSRSPEQLNAVLDDAEKEIAGILDFGDDIVLLKSQVQEFASLKKSFNLVVKSWKSVDVRYLPDDDLVTVYNILHDEIPGWLRWLWFEIVRTNWTGTFQPFRLFCAQTQRQFTRVSAMKKTRSVFPEFFVNDGTVTDTLIKIRSLWEEAVHKPNTEEDEFFLEQVADSYLPHAMNLYESFSEAPEELAEPAKRLLFEQLDSIQQKLIQINHRHLTRSLNEMQTHADFLKTKVFTSSTSFLKPTTIQEEPK